jgi:hypothetical protein
VWYVRVGNGAPRIRIRAEFGTADFTAEYEAALLGTPRTKKGAPSLGTLAWLIDRYRETTAWSSLSLTTRRKRDNIFLHVIETAGTKPFAHITPATIMAGRERRAATPVQARHFLDAMRGVFRWAAKAKMVKADPTLEIENPPHKQGDGFPPSQRNTLLPIRHVGLLERASASGSMYCCTPDSAAVMLFASAVNTSRTVSARSKQRRAASRSP